jgi:hypothetical protein
MALVDEISSVTEELFIPKLVDNIYNSNPVFMRMKERGIKYSGGRDIVQPVLYAQNSNVLAYTGFDTLNIDATTEVTSAKYDWRQYAVAVNIDRLTELKNSGMSAVLDLVQAKLQNAEKSLSDTLGTDLYTGQGGTYKTMNGFDQMVDDGTNVATYGGINRSTDGDPWWKASYDANGGTGRTLTLALMREWVGDVTIGADGPTLITTTQKVFNKVWELYQANQRFVNTNEGLGGFQTLMFDGIPIVVDSKVPIDTATTNERMYILNESYFDLFVHTDEDFRFEPWHMHLDQNARVAKIFFAGNLAGSNCRMHQQVRDINTSL